MNAPIAVVVPVYNRPTVVVDALNSVAAQTWPPARLIVVDDGSTDDTAARIERWIAETKPKFETRLIRQPNGRVSRARNRGATEAGDCDLLTFLDCDDVWPDDYLQRMCDALGQVPDAAAASCDWLRVNLRTGRRKAHHIADIAQETPTKILLFSPTRPCNTVVRAAAFRATGGFYALKIEDRERYGNEDWDFFLRLSLQGRWLYVLGQPVIKRAHTNVQFGGDRSLLAQHDDAAIQRTVIAERFLLQDGGAKAIPERIWRDRLARLWYHAGLNWLRLDRKPEALRAFHRALELDRWHMRARWRALATRDT